MWIGIAVAFLLSLVGGVGLVHYQDHVERERVREMKSEVGLYGQPYKITIKQDDLGRMRDER